MIFTGIINVIRIGGLFKTPGRSECVLSCQKNQDFFQVASAMTEKRNKKSRMADLRSEKSKIGKLKFVFFPLTKRVGGGCVRGG